MAFSFGSSINRRTFVAGSLATVAAAAGLELHVTTPRAYASDASASYTAGEYESSARGRKGTITVRTTFSDSAIDAVEVVECNDTQRISAPACELVPQRIVELQSLAVDTVTGATFSSNAILQAVADCVEQAGGDVAALKSVLPPEKQATTEAIEADLVVCGAGGAGMAAALTAAQAGYNVVVLEKSCCIGGNVLVSGGWLEVLEGVEDKKPEMTDGYREMFAQTLQTSLDNGIDPAIVEKVQADYDAYYAAGNTKVFDSVEFYALDYATRNGGPVEQYWIPFAAGVTDLNNWLFDEGYQIRDTLIGIVGFPWPRKAHSVDGKNGEGFFNLFDAMMEGEGLPVQILTETPVTDLIVEDGRVVGAVGSCVDGTTYEVRSRLGVVMATGGYSGNQDMMKRYNEMWPWDADTIVPTTNNYGHTGDGIVLAQGVGAALANMGKQMVFPIADCKDFSTETIVGHGGLGLYVNTLGKRFTNETLNRFALAAAVMQQPDEKLFIISDVNTAGITDGCNDNGYPIDALLADGQLFMADSLEELAAQIGVDADALIESVENYNAIARGEVADVEFGRANMSEADVIAEAPFYASPRTWAAHVTMGGVAIDGEYRAINEAGEPIEGLYVVGECTDGNSGVSSMSTGRRCVKGIIGA